ncbi:hypothetical protein H5410_061670 [Solanum commersonii]|uniref:Uncharacterized protein n=1 Tax=Solanum commersonii TaxID=4109 RepID=A0A9J5W9W2_SOLCO|nr:hypothetical protein H5410_061670 [Solanum commersonii]
MVESRSKGDKKRYGTRSETQKVMGSAITARLIQTKRARKRRREGHEPEKPTSTPLPIGSSDTESDDVVVYVAKRKKEGEDKRVKSKGIQKAAKTVLLAQNPTSQEMTREERIVEMQNHKVLNGRVFNPDILTTFGMSNIFDVVSLQGWGHLFEPLAPYLHEPERMEEAGLLSIILKIFQDEESLGIILGVPVKGIRSIEDCKPSNEFPKQATKRGDIKRAGLPKNFLKGEYQLLFEFINKDLSEKKEKEKT